MSRFGLARLAGGMGAPVGRRALDAESGTIGSIMKVHRAGVGVFVIVFGWLALTSVGLL